MAITSGFFDSVNGDRLYDADQMSKYFDGLVSDGVYESIGGRFCVRPSSGMAVDVDSGRAIIQSRWVENDDHVILDLDPADMTKNRADAICLRLDLTARNISLVVKKGEPTSGSPIAPGATRNDTVYELLLASVRIDAGATAPTTITDLRPSTMCGWVTGVVQQVNTSDLFNQYLIAYGRQFAEFEQFITEKETAFNEWFRTLTQDLVVQTGVTKIVSFTYVPATADEAIVNVGNLKDYDPDTDILSVFVDGIHWTEGLEYEKSTQQIGPQIFYTIKLLGGKTFGKRSQITYEVLRNVVGETVIEAGSASMIYAGIVEDTVGDADFTEV